MEQNGKIYKYNPNKEFLDLSIKDQREFYSKTCDREFDRLLFKGKDVFVIKVNNIFRCFSKDEIKNMLDKNRYLDNNILDDKTRTVLYMCIVDVPNITREQIKLNQEIIYELIGLLEGQISTYKDFMKFDDETLVDAAILIDRRVELWNTYNDGTVSQEFNALGDLFKNLNIKIPTKNISSGWVNSRIEGSFNDEVFKYLVKSRELNFHKTKINTFCKQIIKDLKYSISYLLKFKKDTHPSLPFQKIEEEIQKFLYDENRFWFITNAGNFSIKVEKLNALVRELEEINNKFIDDEDEEDEDDEYED
jgi:hypothetical protein